MKTEDCQQIQVGRGIKTVAILSSPAGQVAIHEVIGFMAGTPLAADRYFISVDGKMTQQDSEMGQWWRGTTKAECTRNAKALVAKLYATVEARNAAAQSNLRGKEVLVQRHQAVLDRLFGRYVGRLII